jgi:excisionase family DNA binding protein
VQPADGGAQEGKGVVTRSREGGGRASSRLAGDPSNNPRVKLDPAPATQPGASLTLVASDVSPLVDAVTAAVVARLPELQASPWLSVADAAEYLGWPKKRLYNLVASNEIPHRKQGNRLLFNRLELDLWLDGFYHGPDEFLT